MNDGKGLIGQLDERMGHERDNDVPIGLSADGGELQWLRPGVSGHVDERASMPVACESGGGSAPGSGDYNADGNNLDYPDATSYHQLTDNK